MRPVPGRQSGHEPHQRGLNTKLHLAADAFDMPVRAVVTSGAAADCARALRLIEGIDADHPIADKGYDTDAILEQAAAQGVNAAIPPKKSRTAQRAYDKDFHKLRHLVENAFLRLKLFLLGWNDVPEHRPLAPADSESLRLFDPHAFPPLGVSRLLTDNPNRHTYNFYAKRRGT